MTKVFDAEKIEINSSVDKWFDGGVFDVDPDDYIKPSDKPDIPNEKDIESNVSVRDYGDGEDLGSIELKY